CPGAIGGPLGEEDDEGEIQIVQQCQGYGYSDVQTWEPAKYLFNVDHLNETEADASWVHTEPSGDFSVGTNGSCWANPSTFIGTQWQTTYCSPQMLTFFSHGFDLSQTGQYINNDFIFALSLILGHPISANVPITITATASVQFVNGFANWGAQYIEDYPPNLLGLAEGFLLTGKISGNSSD